MNLDKLMELHVKAYQGRWEITNELNKRPLIADLGKGKDGKNYFIVSKDKKKRFGDAKNIAELITYAINNVPNIAAGVQDLKWVINTLQYTVNYSQYPVFVYGTLRSGLGNYRTYLEGKTDKEIPATTKGKMYSTGNFPALIEGDNTIHGELMYIKPELYAQVLFQLDFLEGFDCSEHSMYIRKLVDCYDEQGNVVKAWIYFWNRGIENFPEIKSGDWKSYVKETKIRVEC